EGANPAMVIDRVFDLFDNLGASEAQLDFPVVYASAIQGFATLDMDKPSEDMSPLLQTIIDRVPAPNCHLDGPFQMQISSLDYSSFVGAIGIGRVKRGSIKSNSPVTVVDKNGKTRKGRVLQVFSHMGLERVEVEEA